MGIRYIFTVVSLTFVLLGYSFCEKQPEEGQNKVDRSYIEADDRGIWESSDWYGEKEKLIKIEPGETLYLIHGLGRIPKVVAIYVSFSEKAQYLMPASGNSAEILELNDTILVLHNGTGTKLYYRIVLY